MSPRVAAARAEARVDVDFTLAIHDRTGKYFIGRDLHAIPGLPIGLTFYWGLARGTPPAGLFGRIVGRLQLMHVRGKTIGGVLGWLPRRRSRRPLLHLDPFTVPTVKLTRRDIVLCHDLGPITDPALFDAERAAIYGHIYAEIATVGPHLVFVSEASRRTFATLYPQARPATVRVIYPALRTGLDATEAQPVAGVTAPFLLTVGSFGDRKNQRRCIEAFALSGLAGRGFQYVICGAREPGADPVLAAAAATPGVVCLSYVSDAELRWLYATAGGFVLVSLLEGFGMPVAEAIASGLVPLLSRGSVLEEVAGPAALLADPRDIEEIAAGMAALAALEPQELVRRQAALRAAIKRFSPDLVRTAWRSAFTIFATRFVTETL